MSTKTELDEQIAALEAEIAQLQQRWRPYVRVQPMVPTPFSPPYDPTRFLEKSEISIAIDEKQIELARLQRQRAEQELAEHTEQCAGAEVALREAEVAYEDARKAWNAAQKAWESARGDYQRQAERHGRLTKTVARYANDERRWSDELKRDRDLRESVATRSGRIVWST